MIKYTRKYSGNSEINAVWEITRDSIVTYMKKLCVTFDQTSNNGCLKTRVRKSTNGASSKKWILLQQSDRHKHSISIKLIGEEKLSGR